jgi:hypothetical protein
MRTEAVVFDVVLKQHPSVSQFRSNKPFLFDCNRIFRWCTESLRTSKLQSTSCLNPDYIHLENKNSLLDSHFFRRVKNFIICQ